MAQELPAHTGQQIGEQLRPQMPGQRRPYALAERAVEQRFERTALRRSGVIALEAEELLTELGDDAGHRSDHHYMAHDGRSRAVPGVPHYNRFMRIGMAQMNCTVGDLQGNLGQLLLRANEAHLAGCELLVTPELALTGYPPQDLLFEPGFVSAQLDMLRNRVAPVLELPAIVGFVDLDETGYMYNAAAVIEHGRITAVIHKTLLPTYDVFDELRYFRPASHNQPVTIAGRRVGVTICEDIWDDSYDCKVVSGLVRSGCELLVNVSSSPYHAGKRAVRFELLRRHALAGGLPIVYCNMVGGQDELVFDGESMAVNSKGELIALGPPWEIGLVTADLENAAAIAAPVRSIELELFEALQLGTWDYFSKCRFKRAVIGLSGGIDSSLVACIAAEALGPGNVIGVAMPSAVTSSMSNEDAATLAANLGIEFRVLPIAESVDVAMRRYAAEFGGYSSPVTLENLQARERGKILMEISNDLSALVLSTGNKTEYALGYTTLYGDMCGGLAVLGDVSKPMVYAISRYYNTLRGETVIPERVFERPPSAELREGQVDPFDYARISPLVELIIEEHKGRSELLELGYTHEEISIVQKLVRGSEYKRKQAPPILRVSEKAFGIGRRMPIVNLYELEAPI